MTNENKEKKMTNENALEYRGKIDSLETQIRDKKEDFKKEKDKSKKEKIYKEIKNLEDNLDKVYEEIFNEFEKDIELKSVDEINEQTILFSEFLGRYLVQLNLSTSQIRNVYGEVLRLKMKGFDKNKLVLLKPRLAYSTERKEGADGSKKFREVIEKALDKVIFNEGNEEILFENFANFFEAILAYHRSFGGK